MQRSWWSFWPKKPFSYRRLATMDVHRSSYEMERQLSARGIFPGYPTSMGKSRGSFNSQASDASIPSSLLSRTSSNVNPNRPWYHRAHKFMQHWTKKLIESQTKQNLKYINASKHVLSTYHDSFLFGELPRFVSIRAAMRTGKIGKTWSIVEFLLAALSGGLHVYSTYHEKDMDDINWVTRTQDAASCIFVADYLLRLYCEPVRVLYMFSTWGLIDLLSAMPIIFVFKPRIRHGSILHLLQFLRVIRYHLLTCCRITSVFSEMGFAGSTLVQKILLVAMTTMGAVFLSAGIMQWIESEVVPSKEKQQCPASGCLNFLDAFYYIVVTVATVGYGDITPKTVLGKLLAVVIIIAALIYIPLQVSRINSLASLRPYGGSFSSRMVIDSRYIILTGSISYQAVQDCLAEFYSITHHEDNFAYPLRVNILAPFQPSYELKNLLALYNGLVEFIEGSPVYQSDLERVCASKATAIFILANKATNNTKAEDAVQVVRALAVHRVCAHPVRIIVEVLDPTTQTSAVWDETQSGRIEIICPAKLHYKMLSRSCVVRGLYTLIGNLFTSKIKLKNDSEYEFLTEFFHSYDNEIYPVILPNSYHNLTFEEVANHVYLTFDSILFALDVPIRHKKKAHIVNKVLLYPKGHIIEPEDIGLVISRDIKIAFAISNQGIQGLQKRLCGPDIVEKSYHEPPNMVENEQPVESVIDRWKRTGTVTTMNINRDSVYPTSNSSNIEDLRAFPLNPDGTYKLETQLRSAIHESQLDGFSTTTNDSTTKNIESNNIHTNNVEDSFIPNWLNKHYEDVKQLASSNTTISTNNEMPTTSTNNVVKKSQHSMSLESATEKLLSWPPLSTYGQPHPVVLERRADVILKDLKEKTLAIVEFPEPHILLCCQSTWPNHLFYFIKGLRRFNNHHPPIVILFPLEPSSEQWGLVGIFKNVYLIKGSPIFELDLMRGGVLQAEKVVIFASLSVSIGSLKAQQVQDHARYQTKVKSTYVSDVDNILVAANVDRLVGEKVSSVLIIEMQHIIGFDYLRPQFGVLRSRAHEFCSRKDYNRNRDALLHLGPPFMEGRATSPILLGFLMRSTFYNRNTVSIVEQIVDGGYIEEEDGCLSDDRNGRVLEQISIPKIYANRPYIDLFMGLLNKKEILAIGLYRAKGTLGSPTSYVLTNPPKNCIVNSDDMVYVFM